MERSVYIRSIIAIVIRRTEMDKSREMAYVSTDKTDFEIHHAPRIYSFLVYFFDRNRSMKRSISIKRKYANTFKKINNMDRSMFKIYISWIKTKKKVSKAIAKKRYVFNFNQNLFDYIRFVRSFLLRKSKINSKAGSNIQSRNYTYDPGVG